MGGIGKAYLLQVLEICCGERGVLVPLSLRAKRQALYRVVSKHRGYWCIIQWSEYDGYKVYLQQVPEPANYDRCLSRMHLKYTSR